MTLNEGEIDQYLELINQNTPEYAPYIQFLSDWRDIVNDNSDGWAYWKQGRMAADRLCTLMQKVVYSLRGQGKLPPHDECKNALNPIRHMAKKNNFDIPELQSAADIKRLKF